MIDRRSLIAAAGALSLLPRAAWAQDGGSFVDLGAVPSKYIAPTKVTVWLPPAYDASKQRYGVVYMHDSQNLFDPKRSNFNKVWAADKSALRLIAAGKVKPFIIVGIDHPGEDRGRQYFPRVMADLVSPALRKKLEAQGNGKTIISNEYLKFMVDELKPMIDRRYRTKRSAKFQHCEL